MVWVRASAQAVLPDIKGFSPSFKACSYQIADYRLKCRKKRTPNLYEGPGSEWEWENRLAAIIPHTICVVWLEVAYSME
ncbi:hypothetical protein GGR96_001990 [Thalassospira tepidiphila]|uniref:Uncharacterized protein n=2 Tax=Thalassospira tepidiphila TaxID=393657 RepID=A0A853L0U0_9PROT|nr:hypothetical protein [Thalassospira tepidiphila]OAZ10298.1 hypothetical protein TH4_08630 [Thalassospira tepidiphila MCCC 1A03514]BDW89432.1 hypothetical protein MACH01_21990 [Thalassospira tepidiphila]